MRVFRSQVRRGGLAEPDNVEAAAGYQKLEVPTILEAVETHSTTEESPDMSETIPYISAGDEMEVSAVGQMSQSLDARDTAANQTQESCANVLAKGTPR